MSRKLDDLKEAVLNDTPYFGTLLSVITIIEMKVGSSLPIIAGIGVNKKFGNLLMYLREDLYDLPMPQQVAVIIHELYHVVFSHVIMGHGLNPQDRMLLNGGMDLVINQEINNLPPTAFTIDKLNLPPNLTTWEYYDLLKKMNPPEDQVQGHDSHDGLEDGKELAEACKDAVLKADQLNKVSANRGCSRKGFNAQKELLINAGSRDIVKSILRQVCKMTVQSKDVEKTYERESRRYQDFPGNKREDKPRFLVGIDTSGSISDELVSDALGVVIQLAKLMGATVECALWHTEVYEVFQVKSTSLSDKTVQSGGTDISDFFDLAQRTAADLTLVITDGQFEMPAYPKKTKVVWLLNTPNPEFVQPRTIRAA